MAGLVLVALMELFVRPWSTPPASLGELARREAIRRWAMPPSVRVVTNADLGPLPLRVAARRSAPAHPASPVDPPAPAAEPAAGEPARDEAWWRARMVSAAAAVERDAVLVAALESRVAALTRDVAGRDDPIRRAALVSDRARAVAELERMRRQLETDTNAIAALEEEARKAGVPPGWLRGGGSSVPIPAS